VTRSNVIVPSMRKAPFPVDDSISFVPCNDVPEMVKSALYEKYIIVGAGKTGMDSVTYLLRHGVDQSRITWIMPRDVWVVLREGLQRKGDNHYKDMDRIISPTLKHSSLADVWKAYEEDGIVARIHPGRPDPTVFKGATIDEKELAGLRTVEDVVRLGRVTAVTGDRVQLEEGTVPLPSPSDTLLVDCMADMDRTFYGYLYDDFVHFEEGKINLGPSSTVFNPSLGSALIAYAEATFSDKFDKNSLFYLPPRFGPDDLKPEMLFNLLYAQSKTFAALGRHRPSARIILKSRTNADAPGHHGGLRRFLWGLYGPLGIAKKGDRFVRKVESGGFEDVQDCFGHRAGGRALPSRSDFVTKRKGRAKSGYPPPATEEAKSKPERKGWVNCCATVEVVE